MELRKLEIFALVAGLGSLSKAAKTAGIAQSLVSRQIAQMEEEWGDRLFQRTGRGVILTDFGRHVQPEVQLLLDQAGRLQSAVKDAAGVPTGVVYIGLLSSMSRPLIAPLFEDMRKRAPAVRLRFIEGFSGLLDEQLLSGRLDMAVISRYGPSPDRGEDVLGYVDTYLVSKPDRRASPGESIRFAELAGLPLALPGAPNGLRSVLDQHARQQAVQLDVALEIDTLSAMKDVALSGAAHTILPLMAVREEVNEGRLVVRRITEPSIRRVIALSVTHQRMLSRAGRLTVSRLRDLVLRFLAEPQ
ncbi:MAG: LysR family transcriptional regulator [Oxalobacteraceae bacterium]|jgi:DNA-binding transcriptional LysR family regulator|nr:MAG: LysR family transcriptional regulator [Oxalobacteraceae bacterium]